MAASFTEPRPPVAEPSASSAGGEAYGVVGPSNGRAVEMGPPSADVGEPAHKTPVFKQPSLAPPFHDEHDDLPPLPRLFPARRMTASQMQGDWQLIASSAPAWRVRRNVRATFEFLPDTAGQSSEQHGQGKLGSADRPVAPSMPMNARWVYDEVASYQAKTLTQRIKEDWKGKRRSKGSSEETADGEAAPGERRISVSGKVWEEPSAEGFVYRPHRATLQKALGKDISWEIIAQGPASAQPRTGADGEAVVDWFVAYVHPSTFLQPFISIYFRPEIVQHSSAVTSMLFEDLVDVLHHATDPWTDDEDSNTEERSTAQEQNQPDLMDGPTATGSPAHSRHTSSDADGGRRGRERGRANGSGGDEAAPALSLKKLSSGNHAAGWAHVQRINAGIPSPSGPTAANHQRPWTSVASSKAHLSISSASSTKSSQTSGKAAKRRDEIKWSISRLASELRLVRGV
ncbi:unnamed protein product [Parajaminaea phylloscopi]